MSTYAAVAQSVSVARMPANSETGSLAGFTFTCTCGSRWSTTLSSGHAREIERHEAFHASSAAQS